MFKELLSNTQMKRELTIAAENDKPSHAYLFCGPEGSGKKTAARLFAKAIVGKNSDKADRGSHPDIILIEPEKGKKQITVDIIRSMRADAFIKPSEAKRKIYIIDKAHLVNENGQNALLTILEQPPSFAVFILLSETREKMLPTVVSRCQVFEMEYVSANEGAQLLHSRNPNISIDRFETAMQAASGNIGLALKLADSSDFEKNEKLCETLMLAVAKGDEYMVAKMLNPPKKGSILPFLNMLVMYIKDVTIYKATQNADRLVFRNSVLQNAAEFDKISINTLYESTMAAENAIDLINNYINPALATAELTIQLFGGQPID